jgi:hypothetical protein
MGSSDSDHARQLAGSDPFNSLLENAISAGMHITFIALFRLAIEAAFA